MSKNIFFRTFGPQIGLEIGGGGRARAPRAPPLDPPLIYTEKESVENLYDFFLPQILMNVLPKPIRVTKMLTAQTLTVLLAVHARRDLLETAKHVKVSFFNFLFFDLYSKS